MGQFPAVGVRGRRAIWWAVGSAVAAPVLWFALVDWSWFVELCPRCDHDVNITRYRVAGLTVSEERLRLPDRSVEWILEDAGRPCPHSNMGLWHKHRWWGLVYCARPCWNGMFRFWDGSDRDDYERVRWPEFMRHLARTDPALIDRLEAALDAPADSRRDSREVFDAKRAERRAVFASLHARKAAWLRSFGPVEAVRPRTRGFSRSPDASARASDGYRRP